MEVWDYLCRLSLCNTGIIRVQHNKHMLGKLTNQLLFFFKKKKYVNSISTDLFTFHGYWVK